MNIDLSSFLHFDSVAAGSPGPLDKKIPSGSKFSIFSKLVSSGNTIISAFKFTRCLSIFRLTPKSMTTIFGLKFLFSIFFLDNNL